jgi:hypothetical protein
MRPAEAAAWGLGALLSLGLSVRAARGPTPAPSWPEPRALPRAPTAEEEAQVAQAEADAQAGIHAATAQLGAPPAVEALEGNRPDGSPILPGGLPDNPLIEGVGAVRAGCAPERGADPAPPDWWYCPQTGALVAAYPPQGSE